VTDDTTSVSYLLSGTTLVLALVIFYLARSLWIARREWSRCRADTKILYLLVAPALTLAVDVLEITDRLFWSEAKPPGAARRSQSLRLGLDTAPRR
jgi:hypothetical protein